MKEPSVLFRARVPQARLRRAEEILDQLGLKPGEAFNLLLAQIELRKGLPFEVSLGASPLLSAEEQGDNWNESLGTY